MLSTGRFACPLSTHPFSRRELRKISGAVAVVKTMILAARARDERALKRDGQASRVLNRRAQNSRIGEGKGKEMVLTVSSSSTSTPTTGPHLARCRTQLCLDADMEALALECGCVATAQEHPEVYKERTERR